MAPEIGAAPELWWRSFLQRNATGCLLVILVLLAAFLRIKGLTFQSFWLDELFSASFSDPDNRIQQVVMLTVEDVHPPVYQIILWFWYKIFGYSDLAGRSLSALAGILTVPAIFFAWPAAGR